MSKKKLSKLLALYLPYVVIGLLATNLGEAWRLAVGKELGDKIVSLMGTIPAAFANPLPSLHPFDLFIGLCCGAGMRLAVYLKGKNAKKYRHGMEYGSARWGGPKDIEPFMAPKFEDNIILTKTERLMMSNRPPDPKNARNKNVLVVGGSGSGKTRFFIKPNLLQCNSKDFPVSFVVTDPKGSIGVECGEALLKHGYKLKFFNSINFSKSMRYNPMAYIHSEKDVLKLVTALMTNTKGEGQGGDPFWDKAERLLLVSLIAYLHYEAPVEEQNFATLLEMLNTMQVSEDDETYQNPVDLLFEDLGKKKPKSFAVRQYKLYKLAAGKTAKSILISCGARLSPFDIQEVRDATMYDELELDKLGDRKTALFLITENKKAELFSKVRSGQVRVLLGSTAKMGAGTNVQTLLVAVHHLDVGWRPSDMTQRNGRIIRQGNQNKQVYVYNYVTESTFDAYLYQTLENKQKFISQIMTSKSPMRTCDDIDEQALSYAEIKALCAGDPRIREKMDLDVQVAKLKVLRGDFQNQKYRLEDKLLKTFPEEIQKQKNRIAALQQDSQIAAAHPQDKENFCGMTIKGMVFDDKKAAGERLLLARQEMPNADMMLLGTYRGFELNIRFDSFKNEHQAVLRAELSYPVSLGDDARGNITRLDNAIDNFADRIADAENALQNLEQQKQAAEVEVAKPFAQEEELAEKSARLAELNALLNIDRDRSSSQDAPEETEETETPATRPSVLAALEEKSDKPEPVKPFRSYYDKDGDAR